jgi:hypothetical protein
LRITLSSAQIQIGQVKWGRAVTMPYGVEVGFDPQQEKIDAKVNLSQTGNFVGAIDTFIVRNPPLSLKLIPDAFVRGQNPDQLGYLITNYAEVIKPFFFNWTTDVAYEKDGFFGIVDNAAMIKRTISTPLIYGYRDIQFNLLAPKL